MISLAGDVCEALRGVCAQVFYFYPASWVTLPCVAWRESGNRELSRADGGEYLAELTYTVDIWSDAPETNAAIAAEADMRMAAIGFMRAYSADVFETSTRLHHRVMRFRAVAGADGRIYQ